ncbi:MAG: hypothetical protein K0S55_318 [Clostridia bacterium]|nr:hypothetical protein [Clostridia bacterium]
MILIFQINYKIHSIKSKAFMIYLIISISALTLQFKLIDKLIPPASDDFAPFAGFSGDKLFFNYPLTFILYITSENCLIESQEKHSEVQKRYNIFYIDTSKILICSGIISVLILALINKLNKQLTAFLIPVGGRSPPVTA